MTMLAAGTVAPLQRRAIAYIIDVLIASAIGIVAGLLFFGVWALTGRELTALLFGGPVLGLVSLAWALVYTWMQGGAGSIGMRAQGLRLVSATTGEPLGFGKALLRNLVWGLTAAFVVGYFSVLFDSSGRFQGWHDKAAGALMIDARVSKGDAHPETSAMVLPAPPAPSSVAVPVSAAQPAPPVAQPVAPPTALPEETVVAPRTDAPAPGDPLISFVPGVTQPTPPRTPAPVVSPPATVPPEPVPPAPAPPAPTPSVTTPPAPAAPVAPPAPAAPVAPPAPASSEDDIESTRISIPGHRLVFTWDDGQRVTVSGRTVFGRNPEQEPDAVVVVVRDETRSLSKTHFEAGASPSGGWVMDRHSTNGTLVVRDGARIACPPGQRMPVRLGDALEIGDRIVTIGGYA